MQIEREKKRKGELKELQRLDPNETNIQKLYVMEKKIDDLLLIEILLSFIIKLLVGEGKTKLGEFRMRREFGWKVRKKLKG